MTAAAGPPVPTDYVEAFKNKLRTHGINRPDAATISFLLQCYPQHMLMMAQPSASGADAMLLYRQVMAQPGSQTALKMRSHFDLAIKGPWPQSHPSLVSAVDLKSSSLLVLKLLPPVSEEAQVAAQAERHAIDILALSTLPTDSALVKCAIVNIGVSREHARSLEIGEGDYHAQTEHAQICSKPVAAATVINKHHPQRHSEDRVCACADACCILVTCRCEERQCASEHS